MKYARWFDKEDKDKWWKIQPCSEKDPNAIKFSNEESKQTYAISIKVPAIQVEFRRMLPFEDDNGGKLSYTLNGTLYPDEQVVIYDIGNVKPETEKKRRGRRKKSEIEARSEERRVGKECRSRWSPYH